MNLTYDEMMAKVRDMFPLAESAHDNTGQIILYTNHIQSDHTFKTTASGPSYMMKVHYHNDDEDYRFGPIAYTEREEKLKFYANDETYYEATSDKNKYRLLEHVALGAEEKELAVIEFFILRPC